MNEKRKRWLGSWARFVFFYFVGFTLFFVSAFVIIKVRISSKKEIKVPALAGKLYLDEHNKLTRSGFKVVLEKFERLEYPYGYIVSQSIPAGSMVKDGSPLVLLVNLSKRVVPVPALVGFSERLAAQMLTEIPVGENTYSLTQGVVTHIPSKRPRGEILMQYPAAGAPVLPDFPVSILVSSGKSKTKRKVSLRQFKKSPVELLKKAAYLKKIPLQISTESTLRSGQNGEVVSVKRSKISGETIWQAKVLRYDPSEPLGRLPNYLTWVSPPSKIKKSSVVTLAEREEIEGQSVYKNFTYLMISDQIPVFIKEEARLVFWNGYVNEEDFAVVQKKEEVFNPDLAEKEEETAKPIFVQEKEEAPKKPSRPDYTLKVEGIRI